MNEQELREKLRKLIAPFVFMSGQEGYYDLADDELFKKLNSENDTEVIVDEILGFLRVETK